MNTSTPKPYTSDLPMVLTAPAKVPPGKEDRREAVEPVADPRDSTMPPRPVDEGINSVAAVTAKEAESLSLTPPQRAAIVRLTSGQTRCEAAIAAGVSRSTLYRWMNHDPAFQAAFNAWQQDVLSTAQAQLTSGTRAAVASVLNAIRGGDARLAWKLLESQGVTARPVSGPTDVEELKRQEALEQKKRQIAERKERNRIEEDDFSII